jgi:hypothetical protein
MKIFINGFWSNFTTGSQINYSVFENLFLMIFNEKIEIGNLNNSEILLESVFSKNTYLNYKKWKYTFFFNGEPVKHILNKKFNRFNLIPKYDCILTNRYTNYNYKIINFPLFIAYVDSNNYYKELIENKIINIIPKKAICAVISNNKSSERIYILDKLEKFFKIDYAGNFRNNVNKIEGGYNSLSIINFYSQYKFVICIENTKQETYITEKIINGFLAKTIPIYWGSNNITEHFNENRFINITSLNDKVLNCAIAKIKKIINSDEEYLKVIKEPILKNNYFARTIKDISYDVKGLFKI